MTNLTSQDIEVTTQTVIIKIWGIMPQVKTP